ncbi:MULTISPECIES: hypothetical protein [unclassified Streptomyces]|uniref:hypothetical protein n=1 Tax=unclassified Streptomyces TaxID=2593676 RepID=UPI00234AC9A2|nr:hypothetical protein [Streptomyces sp. M92]WCN01635.1 hypothetical protein M6G08_05900 [Streptomyces sp. M92]
MITTDVFSSDRTFRVWQYTIAHHCRVLLRSSRRTEDDTRIDVHVGGVTAMFLRPSYARISVRVGTDDERDGVISVVGPEPFERGEVLHMIEGDRTSGFIVGGPLQYHESHASDEEPSGFLRMPPTE